MLGLRRYLDNRFDQVLDALCEMEGELKKMAGNVKELDTVLESVSQAVANLGTDLQKVFAFLKANQGNPGVDLTPQIAKGLAIADALAAVDSAALAEENPLPPPP